MFEHHKEGSRYSGSTRYFIHSLCVEASTVIDFHVASKLPVGLNSVD
jgi:hypothetical protein